MYTAISEAIAADRIKEMRAQAARHNLVRQARRDRRAQRDQQAQRERQAQCTQQAQRDQQAQYIRAA